MLSARLTSKKEGMPSQLKFDQLEQEKERVKTKILGNPKEVPDYSEVFNDIFAFNNQVGKGLMFCLQNQMQLAQIFMELVHSFENDRLWEYFSTKSFLQSDEKTTKIGEAPSQDYFSVQNQTVKERSLGPISSKIEKIVGDLGSLLNIFQPTISEVSTDTYKNPTPSSYRSWAQDTKRASMPVVVNKSRDYNGIINPKNQIDIDRRASTDNSQLLNGLKVSHPVNTEPSLDPNNVKKFLKSKQSNLNKKKSSPLEMNLSPRLYEEAKNRSKFMNYIQEDSRVSNISHITKDYNVTRDFVRNPEKERSVSDKFALRPTTGLIPRKDLAEESLNKDNTFNSNSSHMTAQNETAKMFRIADIEENSLIMSLNNTKELPLWEKKAVKELLVEDYADMKTRKNEVGRNSEKRNLVNAKWWRAWKEYVNFDCDDDLRSVIVGIYSRPGKITNRGLLKYDVVQDVGQISGDLELRDNLLEHHDYEIVNKKVFDLLSKWYGCDFEIVRALKMDPFRNNELVLDLYPEKGASDKRSKLLKFKSVSPKGNIGNEKVISNIIHTNLLSFPVRQHLK